MPIEPTIEQQRLARFADNYVKAFNSRRTELEQLGPPAALFGKALGAALIDPFKDGTAIIYVNEDECAKEGIQRGVHLSELNTSESLTDHLQRLTADCLKVLKYKPGMHFLESPIVPPNLPVSELRSICGVNKEVLAPYLKSGSGLSLVGIAVAPNWNVEDSVVTKMEPTRARVFSPIVKVPPGGIPLLQFAFPFIDILWQPELISLDDDSVHRWVQADIDVLSIGIAANLPSKDLAENPFQTVAMHCDKVCDDLAHLIDDPNTVEHHVQKFLEMDAHQFLLFPHPRAVVPRKPLGGHRFIPDFTVHRADGDYHFIEIESPNTSIYQEKGQEPTSGFSHAIQQVEDWLRFVEENLSFVRGEDGLASIYKPSGGVIIGRDKHLGEVARTRFRFKRGESTRISLKTYDMVISEGREFAATLRRMHGGQDASRAPSRR